MKWMEAAWRDLGVAEIAGAQHNPTVVGYFAKVGRAEVKDDETAWCAAFAGACLVEAGLPIHPDKDRRLLARSFLDIGTPIDEPKLGAIVVFDRPEGGDHAGHVAFVTGWTELDIRHVGGNQSNKVSETTTARGRVLGYRWPEPARTPAELAADGSRIVAAASQQKRDGAIATVATTAATVGSAVGGGQSPQVVPPAKLPQGVTDAISQVDAVGKAAGQVKGAVSLIGDFGTFLAARWPLIGSVVAGYFLARMVWKSGLIAAWRTEDANTGAHTGRPANAA